MLTQTLILLGSFVVASPGLATSHQADLRQQTFRLAYLEGELTEPVAYGRGDGRAEDLFRGMPGVVCTLKVLRANPRVDPRMSRPVGRAVDSGMVVRSPCAE
jgi:hypothetical protein